jgi:hypothetical protein
MRPPQLQQPGGENFGELTSMISSNLLANSEIISPRGLSLPLCPLLRGLKDVFCDI